MLSAPSKDTASKRLIFTVTTGRSGTGYLASFLRPARRCAVFHEPAPGFELVMREVQTTPNAALDFWRNEKLPAISKVPEPVYCETSHLFGLGFVEPLLELGIVPDIILLTREKRAVATSLYQLDTIPGRTPKGLTYYLSPDDPGVLAPDEWQGLHDYQLCFWYCLEIERRQRLYAERWRALGRTAVWTSVAELRTFRGARRLLAGLGLRLSPSGWLQYFRYRHVPVNTKTAIKTDRPLPTDIERLEEEVLERINEANCTIFKNTTSEHASSPMSHQTNRQP